MKRLGIMGGTFNPIHNGHIEIARAAYEQFSLEQVLFLPSKSPPHKKDRRIAANKDRIEMVRRAIADYPYFSLSTMEMEREGYSYTSETLKQLKRQYPEYELFFILGADSLHDMEDWHDPEIIFSLAHILCAPRFPLTREEDSGHKQRLSGIYGADISFLNMQPVDISSQDILKKLAFGQEIRGQIPEGAYEYLMEHSVYRGFHLPFHRKEIGWRDEGTGHTKARLEKIQAAMEEELPRKRYYHTLGVADTAACLAMCYGEDIERARLAGMLHDCAKCLSGEEIHARCLAFGIPMTQTQVSHPYLLHGRLGAYYARNRFGIEDEEILSAISFHTTGKPGMTLLEKIIFLADYMEPTRREIKGLPEIRKVAFTDIDRAVCLTLSNTLDYLRSRQGGKNEIDEMTVNAYNYYKRQTEGGIFHEPIQGYGKDCL